MLEETPLYSDAEGAISRSVVGPKQAAAIAYKLIASVDERTAYLASLLYTEGYFTQTGSLIDNADPRAGHRLYNREIAGFVYGQTGHTWGDEIPQIAIHTVSGIVRRVLPETVFTYVSSHRTPVSLRGEKPSVPSDGEFKYFYDTALRRISEVRESDVDFEATHLFFGQEARYVQQALGTRFIRRYASARDESRLFPLVEDKLEIMASYGRLRNADLVPGTVRKLPQSKDALVTAQYGGVEISFIRTPELDTASNNPVNYWQLDRAPRRIVVMKSGALELVSADLR